MATGRQARVRGADYEADRRARPGVLAGPYDGDARVRGDVFYNSIGFVRRGNRLVGRSRDIEVPLTVANTGRSLRLRVPSGYRPGTGSFELVQWLDPDRVAVFAYVGDGASEFNDGGDILVCRLSTWACRLAVRGDGHTPYAVPTAD